MCGTKEYSVARGTPLTMTMPTSSSFTACYYQVTAQNSTFNNLIDYSYTLEILFNTVTAATVSVVNGTDLETASNTQIVYGTP